ncbi:hypothetical protein [Bacillus pumilus]|uniref:hypothetical protein n=1 Tax=Bacillus pumilus TaxID=1408 RepID=UPI0033057CF2
MNLLQKLEAVEIDHTSRISQEDEQFCVKEQTLYNQARLTLNKADKEIKALLSLDSQERYVSKYGVVREMEKAKEDCYKAFIRAITLYFSEKYTVEFNYEKFYKLFSLEELTTYKQVLDQLIEALGGFSFTEMSNEQIKNKINEAVYKFEVKKSTLHLPSFVNFDSDWMGGLQISWRNEEKLTKLFDALSLFEYGESTKINKFVSIEKEMREGSRKAFIFDKYEMENFNKIKSFKAFKNGKVSIEFHTLELANEFANTYLKK